MFGSWSIVYLALLVLGTSALVIDTLDHWQGSTTALRRQVANGANSVNSTHTGRISRSDPTPGSESICEIQLDSSAMLASVAASLFFNFEGDGSSFHAFPICDRPVHVTFQGKTVTFTIASVCGSCQPDDLILTSGAFSQLTNQTDSSIPNATWSIT